MSADTAESPQSREPATPPPTAAQRWANRMPSWLVLRIGLHHKRIPFALIRWLTLRTKDDSLAVGVDYAKR
jgi:hypothetical protein